MTSLTVRAVAYRDAADILDTVAAHLPYGAKAWTGYKAAAEDLRAIADGLDNGET